MRNLGVLGPMIAAGIVIYFSGESLKNWAGQFLNYKVKLRWYLIALGIPLISVIFDTLVLAIIGGDPVEFGVLPGRLVIFVPYFLYQTFLHGGLEEFGWRGFALPRLQNKYNPLIASIIIGFFWAAWHLPLFFQPGSPYYDWLFPLYLFRTISLSIILTWLYNCSKKSLPVVMILHGAGNAVMLLYPFQMDLEAVEMPLILQISMLVFRFVIAAVIIITSGKNLGKDQNQKADILSQFK